METKEHKEYMKKEKGKNLGAIMELELKLAVKTVMDVLMTTGVYPKAFIEVNKEGKETKRTERTEWQEGWNAADWEIFRKTQEALNKLGEGISDELALLMIADVGYMQDDKFILNMNDTFSYGSDAEEVPEDEIKEAANLFCKYGYGGLTYWVAKKRGYDPERPKYRDQVREIRSMENKE
jgi:hypothetical protein